MRKLLGILLIVVGPMVLAETPPPILIDAPIFDVQIPDRFDTTSNAYVVAVGKFRSGCYKWVGADVQQKPNFVTEIRSYASLSQGMCIQMIIPFQARIQLGQLAPGTYQLHFVKSDGSYIDQQLTIQ